MRQKEITYISTWLPRSTASFAIRTAIGPVGSISRARLRAVLYEDRSSVTRLRIPKSQNKLTKEGFRRVNLADECRTIFLGGACGQDPASEDKLLGTRDTNQARESLSAASADMTIEG